MTGNKRCALSGFGHIGIHKVGDNMEIIVKVSKLSLGKTVLSDCALIARMWGNITQSLSHANLCIRDHKSGWITWRPI